MLTPAASSTRSSDILDSLESLDAAEPPLAPTTKASPFFQNRNTSVVSLVLFLHRLHRGELLSVVVGDAAGRCDRQGRGAGRL